MRSASDIEIESCVPCPHRPSATLGHKHGVSDCCNANEIPIKICCGHSDALLACTDSVIGTHAEMIVMMLQEAEASGMGMQGISIRGDKQGKRPDSSQSASSRLKLQQAAASLPSDAPAVAELEAGPHRHTAKPCKADCVPPRPAEPDKPAQALLQHVADGTDDLLPGSPGQIQAIESMSCALHCGTQEAGSFSR